MTTVKDIKKAPDGGWGWFVCLGTSLITLSLRSLDPSFGLLFNEPLKKLNIDSTGASLIMSILDAIVNFSGLFVGPLLKNFSYRKVAFFGSVLSCMGLILTSCANSMIHIICTYSILGGLGTGLALASSFVALNTFFDKKRGQAVGFSMAGTTLAMMLVPQLIHVLLDAYGFQGSILIIGACALHSAVGACLLRPVESGNRTVIKRGPKQPTESDTLLNKNGNGVVKEVDNDNDNDHDHDHDHDHDPPRDDSLIKHETKDKKKDESYVGILKETLDLDLLKDGVYLNVIVGLSFYYVAESNFKLMTPFFLTSIGMSNVEVATCLSITAFTDIIARILLPTIFDKLGFKKRSVFWVFCLLVGIGRSVMAVQSKGIWLIVTFVIIGFLRGATLVNLNLSVSECCSLQKLPNAFGMFMVAKGIFVIMMSPLIGYIRDVSESYTICIHVMTLMISITFVMWSVEYIYDACRRRRSFLNRVNNAKTEAI